MSKLIILHNESGQEILVNPDNISLVFNNSDDERWMITAGSDISTYISKESYDLLRSLAVNSDSDKKDDINVYQYLDRQTGYSYYILAEEVYSSAIKYYEVYCIDTKHYYQNNKDTAKLLLFDDTNVINLKQVKNPQEIYSKYFANGKD